MAESNDIFAADDECEVTLEQAKDLYLSTVLRELERETDSDRRKRITKDVKAQWASFRRAFRIGDRIREFKSPPHKWKMLMGQHGIDLVRDGKSIKTLFILVN